VIKEMNENIKLNEAGNGIIIIDQTLLPNEEKYIELKTPEEMYEAIEKLRVRGAPAIGIFAGYAMAVVANTQLAYKPIRSCCGANWTSDDVFIQEMKEKGDYLKSSRPTAINLAWAVDRVIQAARIEMYRARNEQPGRPNVNAGAARLAEAVLREAEAIHEEDKAMCKAIAEHALTLLKDGDGILTHCNAGPLATSEYGTALGPIFLGTEKGMKFHVFADETRPLLQGARLTAYELQKAGVDVTLICDNMASIVMNKGLVQAVLVGCDRVAANGDVANKIGTSGIAILAKHYGIPFFVLGPSSTIDSKCATGADIPIEERDPDEISQLYFAEPVAPEGIKCYNPAFDVTDNSLITAIVTEKGINRPPYSF
jgi:methylthioribose-1-phosphate isomerase